MTVEELKRHRLYPLLTPKERTFLERYIEYGGDIARSIKDSYGAVGSNNVWRIARTLQGRKIVKEIIRVADGQGEPSWDDLMEIAADLAHTAKSEIVRLKALNTVARLKRRKTQATEQKHKLAKFLDEVTE